MPARIDPCRRPSSAESGQAFPLVLLVVALAVGLCLVVARSGAMAGDRARARTAADAAALGAAAEGDEAARRLATANGATVVAIRRVGGEVEVVVRVGDVTAAARARRTG